MHLERCFPLAIYAETSAYRGRCIASSQSCCWHFSACRHLPRYSLSWASAPAMMRACPPVVDATVRTTVPCPRLSDPNSPCVHVSGARHPAGAHSKLRRRSRRSLIPSPPLCSFQSFFPRCSPTLPVSRRLNVFAVSRASAPATSAAHPSSRFLKPRS